MHNNFCESIKDTIRKVVSKFFTAFIPRLLFGQHILTKINNGTHHFIPTSLHCSKLDKLSVFDIVHEVAPACTCVSNLYRLQVFNSFGIFLLKLNALLNVQAFIGKHCFQSLLVGSELISSHFISTLSRNKSSAFQGVNVFHVESVHVDNILTLDFKVAFCLVLSKLRRNSCCIDASSCSPVDFGLHFLQFFIKFSVGHFKRSTGELNNLSVKFCHQVVHSTFVFLEITLNTTDGFFCFLRMSRSKVCLNASFLLISHSSTMSNLG